MAAAGLIWMRPRDMAKTGQLALDRGRWKGEQIISEGWIDAATGRQVTTSNGEPYVSTGLPWRANDKLGQNHFAWSISSPPHCRCCLSRATIQEANQFALLTCGHTNRLTISSPLSQT
jgi:CubicO group peptidase (beta-lactamase class C family)